MRVWVTRAQPAADATAAQLRALGYDAIVAPLLEVRAIEQPSVELSGVGALAVTSANAVPAFAALTADRSLAVYAVGEATARAARGAGFTVAAVAEGDVHALAHRITADGAPPGVVLHPGALEPAADLAALLTAMGVSARNLPVYRTEAVTALPVGLPSPPDVVLLHSPKAGRVLAGLLPPHWAPAMDALVLSPACGAPLLSMGFRRLEAARFPNEAALLRLLGHEPDRAD